MYARRRNQIDTAAGQDDVLFGISVPGESVVNNIRCDVHLVGKNSFTQGESAWYGVEGWILPIMDPDTTANYNVTWDRLVPKDTDGNMDLDTGAQDQSSFFEPGESDWSQLLDIGLRPRRVYQRLRLLSYATAPKPHTESDAVKWTPTDAFRVQVARRLYVKQPSVLLFAVGSPNVDDVTTTQEQHLEEDEWGRVAYAEHMVEQAQMDLLGLTDGGTSIASATDLIQKHMEPDMYNQTAGSWRGLAAKVWGDALIDHSVKGRLGKVSLSTGR